MKRLYIPAYRIPDLLDGSLTEWAVPAKLPKWADNGFAIEPSYDSWPQATGKITGCKFRIIPPIQPGETVYVPERFCKRAFLWDWYSPALMPASVARIFLKITAVRPEQRGDGWIWVYKFERVKP